jgi:hypothetical protein
LGQLLIEIVTQIEQLSLEKLEALNEKLLDFTSLADWLKNCPE